MAVRYIYIYDIHSGLLQVRENEISLRKYCTHCEVVHLRGNVGYKKLKSWFEALVKYFYYILLLFHHSQFFYYYCMVTASHNNLQF